MKTDLTFGESRTSHALTTTSDHYLDSHSATARECLICDTSGSMQDEGFQTGISKLDLMEEACGRFLEEKRTRRPQDSIACVGYSDNATICCPWLPIGTKHDAIRGAFASVQSLLHGGTCLFTGLESAAALLDACKGCRGLLARRQACPVRVIAYSDGHDHDTRRALHLAAKLKQRGCLIETLGIARSPSGVDEAFLRNVATRDPDGFVHYRFLGSGLDVVETFQELGAGTLTF